MVGYVCLTMHVHLQKLLTISGVVLRRLAPWQSLLDLGLRYGPKTLSTGTFTGTENATVGRGVMCCCKFELVMSLHGVVLALVVGLAPEQAKDGRVEGGTMDLKKRKHF